MRQANIPDVKICGVCRPVDAAIAVDMGATHIGVIRVPGTPRFVHHDDARLVCLAAASAVCVGVFMDAALQSVLLEADLLGLHAVQLHGSETPDMVGALQDAGLEVWKTVQPTTPKELVDALGRYEAADLVLVEGRSASGVGGVGASFDWDGLEESLAWLSARRRLGVGGGLTPENVADAVTRFAPALVDVSSGVEARPGEKRASQMRRFIEAVRGVAPQWAEDRQ